MSPYEAAAMYKTSMQSFTPCVAIAAVGLLSVIGGASVDAQDAGPNATPSALRTEYLADMAEVEKKVLALAEAFPAERYAWRPGPGVRSVSEVLMHIAGEHYYFLPRSLGSPPPADLNMGTGEAIAVNLEKITAKPDVIRHVRASFAYQKSVLEGADAKLASGRIGRRTVSGLFTLFIADQHEHLGQLIAYARMNGVVPPWSVKAGD